MIAKRCRPLKDNHLKATVRISVIVPTFNNGQQLSECLAALIAASDSDSEIIVVDDASTDDTPLLAARPGVRVLRLTENSGPAAARNYGASHSGGDILFFVDADVVVRSDAIHRVSQTFDNNPGIAALFGSYDNRPRAKGVVSQYRNLLHHFVHQNGNPDAATFWAGCGAVRRSVFEAVGGFNEKFRPVCSIEDVELGYRIRQAGHRILLDKEVQGTHLKSWTLLSMLLTDIIRRAIPWSRLIMERKNAPNDLNLKLGQRMSALLVMLACLLVLFGFFRLEAFAIAAAVLLVVIVLNRDLFLFFYRQRGLFFAIACIPLHLLYYFYSTLSYVFVWAGFQVRRLVTGRRISTAKPVGESLDSEKRPA